MVIYKAHEDRRNWEQQLADGWWLKYHPLTQKFYTYDPKNEDDTFGSRGALTKANIRKLVKKGVIEPIGSLGEIFKKKEPTHEQASDD